MDEISRNSNNLRIRCRILSFSGKILLGITLLLGLAACENSITEFRMRMLPEETASGPSPLNPIFEQKSLIRIVHVPTEPGSSGIDLLASGDVDLALVENSSPFHPGIRAVLPVFKSVLHLLIRDGADFSNQEQPLRNKSIYIYEGSAAGKTFLQIAASRQQLQANDYTITTELIPSETDLIIYFGPISPRDTSWYVGGYTLLSMADGDGTQALSSDAISYLIPQMQAKIIPAHTYDLPGNDKPVHSLEVDTLLATHKDVPVHAIYELTKTLLERKPWFSAIAPEVFSGITENFDVMSLNQPLHSGARRYLERDDPSVLERYAETINMLVYLFFLFITAIIGLSRWHAHRKKDRIDEFYSRIMAIRMRAMTEPHGPLLHELQQLELEAFDSLIAEKLAANESFRIFIELLTRAISELDLNKHPQ
ncbi:MAG: TAXI family TRAP transporter solute-binding subunit [Halioglobus sp.]